MVKPSEITPQQIHNAYEFAAPALTRLFNAHQHLQPSDLLSLKMSELSHMLAWYAQIMVDQAHVRTLATLSTVQDSVEEALRQHPLRLNPPNNPAKLEKPKHYANCEKTLFGCFDHVGPCAWGHRCTCGAERRKVDGEPETARSCDGRMGLEQAGESLVHGAASVDPELRG